MVCPYCHSPNTRVVNSRSHSTTPEVWRRRTCARCKTVFTSYETPSPKELPLVTDSRHPPRPFSKPTLMISIHSCLDDTIDAPERASALTDTVFHQLAALHQATLSTADIARFTYTCLSHYNKHSALRYGVEHRILTPSHIVL